MQSRMSLEARLAAARTDPAGAFSEPREVVGFEGATREQKIDILCRWEYDARELSVLEEEAPRTVDRASLLQAVHQALRDLGYVIDLEHAPPTKQGGL